MKMCIGKKNNNKTDSNVPTFNLTYIAFRVGIGNNNLKYPIISFEFLFAQTCLLNLIPFIDAI